MELNESGFMEERWRVGVEAGRCGGVEAWRCEDVDVCKHLDVQALDCRHCWRCGFMKI